MGRRENRHSRNASVRTILPLRVRGSVWRICPLASLLLAFALMTALASSRLAFVAKRNGGGLIVRAAGTEACFFRNSNRQRLTR